MQETAGIGIDTAFALRRRGLRGAWAALRDRIWREWCFVRVLARTFRWRVLVLALTLVGGALLFQFIEGHRFVVGLYFTWSLIFGEAPEAFPRALPLQVLYFAVPVLGLVIIIDSIVEFAAVLRDRRRFERNWCLAMTQSLSNHVVLVGLGRPGFRVYTVLRALGQPVVVLERAADREFVDAVRRDGSPILIGDARQEALLVDANIAAATSIVIATNDDLANLEIALDARRLAPRVRVVLRMFDQNMADKIRDGFKIRIAMSQSALSAPAFAMAAVEPDIVNSTIVGDRILVMQRWFAHPGGPLERKSVGEIMTQFGFGVVERQSDAAAPQLFPPPDTRISAGDRLLVQGPFEALADIRKRGLQLAQSVAAR